jgi:hypothetical protein
MGSFYSALQAYYEVMIFKIGESCQSKMHVRSMQTWKLLTYVETSASQSPPASYIGSPLLDGVKET